jgi:GGDEF domain-containing protein
VYDADGKDDISVLKGVLPVMSRYASGYHPIRYTVCYEYAKATNKALKQDVDAELQHVERRSASQAYAVYVKHVVDPAERAVIMLDIDHFKAVNDTFCHPLGDAVIAAVGQLIRDSVGAPGLAARYGGEEFAVLLPGQALAAAEKLAQRIRERADRALYAAKHAGRNRVALES